MIKKIWSAAVVILVAFLLQTTLFRALSLADVVPNILLVVTISYGYMRGRSAGLITGLICGLMLDMLYGSVIGLYGFMLMTIGFVIGYLRRYYNTDSILLPIVLISVSDLAYGIYCYITEFLLRGRLHMGFFFLHVILPEIVYTAIVGIFLFYLITWFDQIIHIESSEEV